MVLVARGPHLEALRRDGLRLRTPDEDVRLAVPVVGGPDELTLTPDDVLVFATKTQQVDAALRTWADVDVHADGRVVGTAGALLPALTALNGVAAESMAQRYFARVVGVCVWMPAVHLEPGEVIVRGAPTSGMLHLGSGTRGTGGRPAGDRQRRPRRGDLRRPAPRRRDAVEVPQAPQQPRQRAAGAGRTGGRHPWARRAARRRGARGPRRRPDRRAPPTRRRRPLARPGSPCTPCRACPTTSGAPPGSRCSAGPGTSRPTTSTARSPGSRTGCGREAPLNARLASLVRQAADRGQQPGAVTADEVAEALGLPAAQ